MIDWIKSWFGKGRVRAKFEGIDKHGNTVTGDAKAPYVGAWDENAMLKYMQNEIMLKYGVTVTKIQLVAHVED